MKIGRAFLVVMTVAVMATGWELAAAAAVRAPRAEDREIAIRGAVGRPGVQVLPEERKTTLLEAIRRAGGFQDDAQRRQVQVTRSLLNGDVVKTFTVDLSPKVEEPFTVEPGDVVFVPRAIDRPGRFQKRAP